MIQRTLILCCAALFALLGAGCISYDYEGTCAENETDADTMKLYTDAKRIPSEYTELGTATVSGNYQNISRERMIDKLKSKAADCGADAILITEQQVLPVAEDAPSGGAFRTAFNADDTNNGWNQLYSDVDQNYGNIRNKQAATTTVYRRIIRAKFLKFSAPEAEK